MIGKVGSMKKRREKRLAHLVKTGRKAGCEYGTFPLGSNMRVTPTVKRVGRREKVKATNLKPRTSIKTHRQKFPRNRTTGRIG